MTPADTLIKTVLDEVRVVGLYPGNLGANVIEFGKKTQNKVREVPLSDLHNNEIGKANPHVVDATGGERVPHDGQFDPFD